MATFGNENIESLFYDYDYASIIVGSWYTCPEKGVADTITMYHRLSMFRKYKYVIYRKSDGVKIGETEEGEGTSDLWWMPLNFVAPKPKLEAVDYWLAIIMSGKTLTPFYKSKTNGAFTAQVITYPTAPDPLVPGLDHIQHSMYCTYTPTPPANPLISKPLICPVIASKPIIR